MLENNELPMEVSARHINSGIVNYWRGMLWLTHLVPYIVINAHQGSIMSIIRKEGERYIHCAHVFSPHSLHIDAYILR